jgi:hypothetical protein
MSVFQMNDQVRVSCPGHRQDGRTGTVVYFGTFMGTYGVEIEDRTYGFHPDELSLATKEDTK